MTTFVIGTSGNDTLQSDSLDNYIISGGAGDDTIIAAGDDAIQYMRGDGHDVIDNAQGITTLQFLNGVRFSDLTFSIQGSDLRIDIGGPVQLPVGSITVTDFEENQLTSITSMYDATPLTWQNVLDLAGYVPPPNNVLNGTEGNDTLVATTTQTEINGLGGNDTITAANVDTLIHGGDGRDRVYGGSGNDTIYGDGGNDVLSGYDGNDVIYGGDGDDFLTGNGGTDVIYGGAGNDTLAANIGGPGQIVSGGTGDDSIDAVSDEDVLYNLGDGHDQIHSALGVTDLRLGSGITLDDLSFSVQGTSLRIDIAGAQAGSITVTDIELYGLSGLYFADSSSLTWQDMLDLAGWVPPGPVLTGTSGDDTLVGIGTTQEIYGLEGDDTITGGSFTTTIDAGAGNDTIYDLASWGATILGGDGNDFISSSYGASVTGGKGDDYIDLYMVSGASATYAAGDGNDTLSVMYTSGDLYLTGGIQLSDLTFSQPYSDQLVIDIASVGGEDAGQIVVSGLDWGGSIGSIVFGNSSSIGWEDILDLANGGGSSLQSEPLIQAMASYNSDSGSAAIVPGDIQQDNFAMLAPAVA